MKCDASMHLCTYIHSYTTWNNIIWITIATYFKCAIIKSIPRWVLNRAYSWCLLNTPNSIRSKSVKELYIVTAYIWKYIAFRICIWSAKHQEHHSNYKHHNSFIGSEFPHYIIRVETRSGPPGHILSKSSRSDPVYKISRSDLDSTLIMMSNPDQSDELNVLNGDDGSTSPDFPQDTLTEWLCNRVFWSFSA